MLNAQSLSPVQLFVTPGTSRLLCPWFSTQVCAYQGAHVGLIPGLERCPEEGNDSLNSVLLLGKPMETTVHRVEKS